MPEVEAVTEISKEEFLNIARRASEEIKGLRAQIQFLAPKAQAYDSIVMILGLVPQRGQTMGEDLAFLLDRRVEALTRENKPKPTHLTVEGRCDCDECESLRNKY